MQQLTIDQAMQIASQHLQAGRLAEAEPIYRQILAQFPNHPYALHHLGMIAHQVGQHEQARQMMQRSLELEPSSPEFHQNLGLVLHALGRFEQAIEQCRAAISLNPKLAGGHNNLGNSLQSLNRLDEAIEAYKTAVALKPDYVEAIVNLGTTYEIKDEYSASIEMYRRAMQVRPEFAGAHANLANVMLLLGRIEESIALDRHAIAAIPNHWALRGNLMMNFHYLPDLSPREVLRLHREHTSRLDEITAAAPPHTNDRSPDRRLRIGYISSDFRSHPISYFLEPILRHHDHTQFEIFCFNDAPVPDATTVRFQTLPDRWVPVFGLTDAEFADAVRREQIDLLIELSVHTAGNRLLAIAQKPAPIQLTYLGFCGTTAMTAIDYRITDAVVDPPEIDEKEVGTEKLLRLPNIFCAYQPPQEATELSELPASGNTDPVITFGALCTLSKVNPKVIDLWSKLLHAVPESRLLVRARGLNDPKIAAEFAARFEAHGISRDRLELLRRAPLREYLETFTRIDVELDPFPFSAHTTTCHALWMGAAVVTLPGQTPVSRVSASVLRAVGLPELIANSPEDYIRIAGELARDRDRLNALRKGLRERMKNSPLMDGASLTRNLEAQLRNVWRDFCNVKTS